MARRFPLYPNHETVDCINCDDLLMNSAPFLMDHPVGQWQKYCCKCEMWNFYIIGEENEEKQRPYGVKKEI